MMILSRYTIQNLYKLFLSFLGISISVIGDRSVGFLQVDGIRETPRRQEVKLIKRYLPRRK